MQGGSKRLFLSLGKLQERQVGLLESVLPGWDIVSEGLDEVTDEHYRQAEIVFGWNAKAGALCLSPESGLKWLQASSAGVNYLPLERLKDKGVVVTDASGVHAYPVSESAFAMMLAFTRKVHEAVRAQADRRWAELRRIEEMHHRTIGIVGAGQIGQEVARIAKAFRMNVLGVRRSGGPLPDFDEMATLDGLDEVLARSDYVVNILPLTPETRRLFTRERFRIMKPGALFVNVGRGQTVDTDALVAALREGWIAGAALDVFEEEPLPPDHPLWSMKQVIVTPHSSGYTRSYRERMLDILTDNARAYAAGKPLPRNVVPYDAGY